MPFRNDESHLADILESIGNPHEFIDGMRFEDYAADTKTRSAVERQLQILTETAIRLGERAEELCPGIDWKGVRGMGNILRHDYHRISNEVVWNTIKLDLPPMKKAVEAALGRLSLN